MSTPPAPPSQPLDVLTMPLLGVQLIEASAGTGKTWTLAALYVRLVLGHGCAQGPAAGGLYPPQLLVMTFTEAATAELRGRIRARLAQAAHYFAKPEQALDDDFLQALRASYAPEHWPRCAQRLEVAAQWMDDAAIYTIHGWSSRMLTQHAFDSANLFQQSRVEDGQRLLRAAVQDYWRTWYYPLTVQQLPQVQKLARSPEALLQALVPQWRLMDKGPNQPVYSGPAPDALLAQWANWQAQSLKLQTQLRAQWTPEVLALIEQAGASKVLRGYPAHHMKSRLGHMAEWLEGRDSKLKTLEWFSLSTLLQQGWQEAQALPVFATIEALCQHLRDQPQVHEALLGHAAQSVREAYQAAKAQAGQFDFSDLLQRLYHALQASDGRLAAAIRQQYPVALVDEFQDTDPWQYGALQRLYVQAEPAASALVLIGDPKQAIYSFRGADLPTYLSARQQVHTVHTLRHNRRSSPQLVAAVNHVFEQATEAFGALSFVPAEPAMASVGGVWVHGQLQSPMTVWQQDFERVPNKDTMQHQLAEVAATQMVELLNHGSGPRGPLAPGDMAVLVRNHREARAIRQALMSRGVPSVYLSERDSVFATSQAMDLWRVLRAVANPRANTEVRAAVSTRLWGLPVDALDALLHDEQAWEAQLAAFHRWQQMWQTRGFLPMLYQLLHEQGIPQALMAHSQGAERALTNLLHLGDLLQNASQQLQGEGALLRYLEDQLHDPQASGEAAQLRLESDAKLVQVVTMHKSKGLQYPLVFLPFASSYAAPRQETADELQQRLAEDMRLLYVALTRAQYGLWLGVSLVFGDMQGQQPKPRSALSCLLNRQAVDDLPACLAVWAQCPHIAVLPAPQPHNARWQPPDDGPLPVSVPVPQRQLHSDWWTASFTALVQDLAGPRVHDAPTSERDTRLADAQLDHRPGLATDSMGAGDDALNTAVQATTLAYNAFPAGSAYGTLLHDLLQWQAEQNWPLSRMQADEALACAWQRVLTGKAQRLGLDEAQCALLQQWLQTMITQPLALPGSDTPLAGLQALSPEQAWPEMGFTLSVHAVRSAELDQCIQAHVGVGQARVPLQPRKLHGMLVGFMDLVLQHQGRYYVLDYKSNRLPSYEAAALQTAMLAHRYDVQACLYLLALHRLLKARLPAYNYDVHLGGLVYWFVRGLDQAGSGLWTYKPPRALIEALDTMCRREQLQEGSDV